MEFQSTHPSRGATLQTSIQKLVGLISIHAPLTGCDFQSCREINRYLYFNPRTPHGVRLQIYANFPIESPFICKFFIISKSINTYTSRKVTIMSIILVRKPQGFYVHLPFAPFLNHQNAFSFITFFGSEMLYFCLIIISQIVKPETILFFVNQRQKFIL